MLGDGDYYSSEPEAEKIKFISPGQQKIAQSRWRKKLLKDTYDHYIMCVGGELEERLPRSKDFTSAVSSEKRRIG